MCDWKPKFGRDIEDYKCPHKNYGKSKDGAEDFCIFHNNQEDKDPEEFYQGIKGIYNSGKHNFRGFAFPKVFVFERIREEGRINEELNVDHLVFKDADFSEAVFLCDVNLSGSEFTGQSGTSFHRATFSGEGWTNFSWATFSGKGGTNFRGTTFSGKGRANFSSATFSGEGKILFSGRTFEGVTLTVFSDLIVENPDKVTFDGVDLNRVRFLGTDLKDINFNEIWWTNREYRKNRPKKRNMVYDETFQTGTVYQALERAIMKSIIRYEKIEKVSSWLKKLRIIGNGTEDYHYGVFRLYNQLRLNYEKTGRYHEAGDFFIGEMEMRRCGNFEKPFIRVLLHFYRLFSLYGERPLKAFGWLFGSILLFSLLNLAIGMDPIEANSKVETIKRDFFSLRALGDCGFWTDYLTAIRVSLKSITLGKIETDYMISENIWGSIMKIIEAFAAPILGSLFLLAMNRKFRRTKD